MISVIDWAPHVGWRATLRTLNAMSNRAIREADRAHRARQRAKASIDRDRETILTRATNFEDRIRRDPLKALGLSYVPGRGFLGSNFEVSTRAFDFSFQLVSDRPDGPSIVFDPPEFRGLALSVRPLDLLVTKWATFLAVQVGNHDAQPRGQLSSWVKRSDLASSPVFLLDPTSSTYYYPLSNSLKGDVLPGHPKVGIVAFEPFRSPTEIVEIHLSGVKLGLDRNVTTCSFRIANPVLSPAIAATSFSPRLQDRVRSGLDDHIAEAHRPSRGIRFLAFLVIGSVGLFVLLLLVAALWRA